MKARSVQRRRGPAAAPAELWNRVGQVPGLPRIGRLTIGRRLTTCPAWVPAAAAVIVAAVLWGFRPAPGNRGQVRRGVKANAGLDGALAGQRGVGGAASPP